MKINLTNEQERIVEEALKSGRFQTAEEVVGEALVPLVHNSRVEDAHSDGTQGEAVMEMLAFVDANHVRLEGISMKDLLHESRRL